MWKGSFFTFGRNRQVNSYPFASITCENRSYYAFVIRVSKDSQQPGCALRPSTQQSSPTIKKRFRIVTFPVLLRRSRLYAPFRFKNSLGGSR